MTDIPKIFWLLPCLAASMLHGQKKNIEAFPATSKITINARLDEPDWANAPVATDFVMFEPDNGKVAETARRTEVKILYDDQAIYIGAMLYDDAPEKMLSEITERDNLGSAEHFGVFINGFNDGQQEFRFFVSSAGVQLDAFSTEYEDDFIWNAIWSSDVEITEEGWIVEMRIPYAALRFNNSENQVWGLNFYREFRRDRQKFTWNPYDMNIGSFMTQSGTMTGIRNIDPPTRLFFIPYTSYYYDYTDGEAGNRIKAGLDIKYGISDSFTLDAILVPDFGQTKFDNVVLNLSPFEQQFQENRPFFTEGIDLFNIGSLLYSRRIGGPPVAYPTLSADETIENYPNSSDMFNAIKLTGRTKGGLGVGVLNAVTQRAYAEIKNETTGETRRALVEPLVNYNLVVLDQRFNQNSSVSLVNANTTREGSFRDANVSALVWNLYTKANTYGLAGDLKFSKINAPDRSYEGFRAAVNFMKTHGKHRYDIFANYLSRHFDTNDLGILFQNNYHSLYANYSYRIMNPTEWFNTFRFDLTSSVEIENITGRVQQQLVNAQWNFSSRINDYYQIDLKYRPITTYDFYEPRIDGRFSYVPQSLTGGFYFSSNYNRRFALDINPTFELYNEKDRNGFGVYTSPRFRLNDRTLIIAGFGYHKNFNDRGFVDVAQGDIIYGQRNIETYSTTLATRYSINNRMSLNLNVRHYWSYAEYNRIFGLRPDGYLRELGPSALVPIDYNQNLNLWNFDLAYSWWFAPASQLSVMYRNNASDFRNDIIPKFGRNVDNLFSRGVNSVFSVSMRYFIDYNSLKRQK